jgi:uncharacterized protein YjiS (DUF1127 family)
VQTISGASSERRAVALHPCVRELSGTLKRWQFAFKTWRSERAAVNARGALSDRQLKDIGLHRSEITRAVRDRVPPRRTCSRYYRTTSRLRISQ